MFFSFHVRVNNSSSQDNYLAMYLKSSKILKFSTFLYLLIVKGIKQINKNYTNLMLHCFGGEKMTILTVKELAFIEDEIRAEEIIAKTMNWCAAQCKDQELRKTLEEIAEKHQLKIASLSQYFNRTNNTQ